MEESIFMKDKLYILKVLSSILLPYIFSLLKRSNLKSEKFKGETFLLFYFNFIKEEHINLRKIFHNNAKTQAYVTLMRSCDIKSG